MARYYNDITTYGTFTVGEDDAGHDVTFYGATSGVYMMWDESSNRLEFTDNAKIYLGTSSDLQIYHTGSNSVITASGTGDLKITQATDDQDLILLCDDGSGGTTAYLTLDGSTKRVEVDVQMGINAPAAYTAEAAADDLVIGSGSGEVGMTIYSGSSNHGSIYFADDLDEEGAGDSPVGARHGRISYGQDTSDFEFRTGGNQLAAIIAHDGSSFASAVSIPDSTELKFGDSTDFAFQHNGSHNLIKSHTGNLKLINYQDDGDILFYTDDGSGGITTYLTLDGGLGHTTIDKRLRANDNVDFTVGTGNDLRLIHDGTHSYMTNYTGDLYIANHADDKDVVFQSDDGNGSLATYFYLDGSAAVNGGARSIIHLDNVKSKWGTGGDFVLYHDGTDSYITNNTGDVIIQNSVDDKDIILKSDNGSGGTAAYLTLDGSAGLTTVHTPMQLVEATEPDDPPNGHAVIWLHEGGTIYAKITVEETTSLVVIAQPGEG